MSIALLYYGMQNCDIADAVSIGVGSMRDWKRRDSKYAARYDVGAAARLEVQKDKIKSAYHRGAISSDSSDPAIIKLQQQALEKMCPEDYDKNNRPNVINKESDLPDFEIISVS